MFLDASTAFSASVHDARMLRASILYKKCEANELLSRPEQIIEEMHVRPLLLEDGAYSSTTWLVKPYSSNTRLTDTQKKFNKSLSSTRVIVERGFRLLKGRRRCLLRRMDNDIEYVTSVILSCLVLHNITQTI